MATKKKMLQAAAGNAGGGAGGLNVEDVFSTYLYEGNGSSQVIENGINLGQSLGSGSARFGGASTGEYLQTPVSTDFQLGNNDFTLEFFMKVTNDAGQNQEVFSVGDGTGEYDFLVYLSGGNAQVYMSSNGTSWNLINGGSCGNYTIGKWHHIAVTRNVDGVRCYLDGVQGSGHGIGSVNVHQSANQISIGRGQTSKRFDGYLSDFHFVNGTAKYTSDFTVPTSALSADANTKLLTLQQDNLLTDNSTTGHTITEYGGSIYDEPVIGPFDAAEAGEGGLVWLKDRDRVISNRLIDTERGATKNIISSYTGAEFTQSTVTSFNSNGFSLGNESATNSATYNFASWTFRKAPKFFDVVTWSGDNTNSRAISHNLGCEVGAIFIKNLTSSENWVVYHRGAGLSGSIPKTLKLNLTDAAEADNGIIPSAPTTTEFYVSNAQQTNAGGKTYVAYLFAHNDGEADADIIKCGSFTGDSNAEADIDLGFEPQWIMIKSSSSDDNDGWQIYDTMRGIAVGGDEATLSANTSNAEASVNAIDQLNATGWSAKEGSGNTTYIYIAIRRGTKAPESGTEVFGIDTVGSTGDGKSPQLRAPFPVDMSIRKAIISGQVGYNAARLISGQGLTPESTAAEVAIPSFDFDYMNGWGNGTNTNSDFYSWMWKRAPNFFDVVAYSGNGTAGRTVSHNLGVAPEMMWVKGRNAVTNWYVYHKDLTSDVDNWLKLNGTDAEQTDTGFWNTSPTSSDFYLWNGRPNNSGEDYIAYLFASLPGISKVGSYTGNGTSQTIDCGFTSGARFVLIKASSVAYSWMLFDTERGITSGNDSLLLLNTTNAETTAFDSVDPYSSGFTAVQGPYNVNQNGVEYIFYAIA
jgi:hypothetical protein